MARIRLGKLERHALKAQWALVRSARRAVIQANLSGPKPEPVQYATASKGYETRMTHGLYRGLYDPQYSSEKDTGRGLKARKQTVKRPWYVKPDKGHSI